MLNWWQAAVDRINRTGFQKIPGSRQSRFETVDRPSLKPLPSTPFTLQGISQQTVTTTGVIYISQDKTSYSVPYSLQRKKVDILIHPDRLEVWHEHKLVARHIRQPQTGQVILPDHQPPAHRWYEQRDTAELFREFSLRGTHILHWAQEVALRAEHEDKAWRLLVGLSHLAHRYIDRIDTVCRIAMKQERFELRSLRDILKTEDDLTLVKTEEQNLELPTHENIRGPQYFSNMEITV
jgi:hypothetical protein